MCRAEYPWALGAPWYRGGWREDLREQFPLVDWIDQVLKAGEDFVRGIFLDILRCYGRICSEYGVTPPPSRSLIRLGELAAAAGIVAGHVHRTSTIEHLRDFAERLGVESTAVIPGDRQVFAQAVRFFSGSEYRPEDREVIYRFNRELDLNKCYKYSVCLHSLSMINGCRRDGGCAGRRGCIDRTALDLTVIECTHNCDLRCLLTGGQIALLERLGYGLAACGCGTRPEGRAEVERDILETARAIEPLLTSIWGQC